MSPRIFHLCDAFTLREVDFYDSGRFYSRWREWKDWEMLYTFGKIEILDKED